MKKIVALTLACTTAMGLFLSGCAMEDDAAGSAQATAAAAASARWSCAAGVKTSTRTCLTCLRKRPGIKVIYQTAESNEMMYSKVAMGGSGYDVIVPSDYMIAQMIEEGLLAELDFDNIPNFSLIADRFKNLPYDPENLYSVPYTWGTLGIIYNPTMIDDEIDSWEALFDMQYEGKTAMIGNPRDALATALMYLGYSINTTDEAQIREAYDLIAVSKAAGVYQGFFMDEIYDKMEVGETALCTYYAGDYLSMYDEQPRPEVRHPQGGLQLVRGRHVRAEGCQEQDRGRGVDQLHLLHRGLPAEHGLHLVRLPQPGGPGGVPRLLRGADRRGAAGGGLSGHGRPPGGPGPVRDVSQPARRHPDPV